NLGHLTCAGSGKPCGVQVGELEARRCERPCEWLHRAPKSSQFVPAFCPEPSITVCVQVGCELNQLVAPDRRTGLCPGEIRTGDATYGNGLTGSGWAGGPRDQPGNVCVKPSTSSFRVNQEIVIRGVERPNAKAGPTNRNVK